jgi:hypothetical protein
MLWSWVIAVLVYWVLASLHRALSLGQGQISVRWLPAISVLRWFAECFSILQCPLTLDVAHWLRRWALWTTICPVPGTGFSPAYCCPFCLSSLCLLKAHAEISSLPLPLLWFTQSTSLLCVLFQFLVYYSVLLFSFGRTGVILSRGLFWFIPGVAVGMPHATYLLTCGLHLPSSFGAGVWWCRNPPAFSV